MRIPKAMAAVTAGLMLGSCGGNGGDLTAATGSVDQAAMASLLASSATMFTDAMNSMKFDGSTDVALPFSGLNASVGAQSLSQSAGTFDACTVKSGSKADADSDGVAVGFRQDFNCNNIPHGNALMTLSGFYSEIDLDDTKFGMAGGFEFEFEFEDIYQASHETNTGRWQGFWTMKNTATAMTTESKFTAVSSSVPTDPADGLSDFEWQSDWKSSHFPEDMAAPWQKGVYKNSGFFRVTGAYTDQQKKRHEINVVFRVETKDLSYDRTACGTTFFKDGSLSYFDAEGNEFKYSFSGCTMTRTFNGQTL